MFSVGLLKLIKRPILRHTAFKNVIRNYNPKVSILNQSRPNKLFLTCGGLSITGFGLYFTLKSSTIFCKEISREEFLTDNGIRINKKFDSSIWNTLIHFIAPDLIWFLLSIPSALLAAYFNIRINLSLGDLMDVIQKCLKSNIVLPTENIVQHFFTIIKEPVTSLLINYVSQSFFVFIYLYSLFILAEKTANRMRSEMFLKFLSLELDFFDLNNGGNIISALSNDVQEFKSSFKQLISLGIKNLAQIVGCFITLYHISPEMTITINLVIIPIITVAGSQIGKGLRIISKKLQEQLANITNVAFESINNIRTVKILCVEDILFGKFTDEISTFDNLNQKFSFGFAFFQSMTNFTINGIVLITLLYGGYNLLDGKMTAGNLMSFLATTQTIQRSLFQLSLLYGHYIKTSSSLHKIVDYLKIESPNVSGIIIPDILGNIEFKSVVFKYPRRSESVVIDNMNLKLESGKITALCGSSGSGKSTIAMLVENLYNIESGQITLDGIDLNKLNKKWLRKDVIGYISQEPVLFCTTIMENIKFGNPSATDEEAVNAAKLANAHEFIMSFPKGYNTIVGQQGTAVSGGQKQRIAIARAIIKNPKILILDEATSALDTESEALVKDALDAVMEGRTVLVIAHRLSTIRNSDQIIVVDSGRIVEFGTHDELLKKEGKYFNLIQNQNFKSS